MRKCTPTWVYPTSTPMDLPKLLNVPFTEADPMLVTWWSDAKVQKQISSKTEPSSVLSFHRKDLFTETTTEPST